MAAALVAARPLPGPGARAGHGAAVRLAGGGARPGGAGPQLPGGRSAPVGLAAGARRRGAEAGSARGATALRGPGGPLGRLRGAGAGAGVVRARPPAREALPRARAAGTPGDGGDRRSAAGPAPQERRGPQARAAPCSGARVATRRSQRRGDPRCRARGTEGGQAAEGERAGEAPGRASLDHGGAGRKGRCSRGGPDDPPGPRAHRDRPQRGGADRSGHPALDLAGGAARVERAGAAGPVDAPVAALPGGQRGPGAGPGGAARLAGGAPPPAFRPVASGGAPERCGRGGGRAGPAPRRSPPRAPRSSRPTPG